MTLRSLDKAVVHVLLQLPWSKKDGVCVLCGPGTLGIMETLRGPAGNPQGARNSQSSKGIRELDHMKKRDVGKGGAGSLDTGRF